MAPVVIALIDQSQIDIAATENSSSPLSIFKTIVNSVTRRICRCTVFKNRPMLSWA